MRGLDFETRSACNLITEGAYRYATDPTTEAICCSWKTQAGDIVSWWPDWVAKAIGEYPKSAPFENEDATIYDGMYSAWNSAFDRLIWQYVAENEYGFPRTEVEDWLCTSALSRSNGLPGKLENAAIALKLRHRKDARGKELIKLLSIPDGGTRNHPTFNEDPKLLREMIKYCEQDVRVEDGMVQKMRPFLDHELIEFHASERVNDYGIGFDESFAAKAVTYGGMERDVLERKLTKVTDGEVERPSQYQRVKKWLLADYHPIEDPDGKGPRYYPLIEDRETMDLPPPRLSLEAVRMLVVYKDGKRKMSLDKAVRNNLLELYNEDASIMSDKALEVIQLTDLAGRSSVAKYKKMIQRGIDGRVNGAYMFAGAAGTGRFSAHGIQPHNMRRDTVDDFDQSLKDIENQSDEQIIHTLADMMRPTIIGKYLHWSDWSNVEGRGLAWLANNRSAEKKLDMFRHQDAHPDEPDVYERMAERMSLANRQTGKVAELSMGYGGGVGAFQAMARNYGVSVGDKVAKDIQKKWRVANPWAEPFWYELKDAAWQAMARPGNIFHAGRVNYFYTPHSHNGLGTLWCQLPSKRLIAYVNPKFERVPCPWNDKQTMVELTALKANFKPKAGEYEWPRHKLWYGVLAENITQAMCADLLRHALVLFDQAGLQVALHTHDEVIVDDARDVSDQVQEIMHTLPWWAAGLPLVADINRGYRYKMALRS